MCWVYKVLCVGHIRYYVLGESLLTLKGVAPPLEEVCRWMSMCIDMCVGMYISMCINVCVVVSRHVAVTSPYGSIGM